MNHIPKTFELHGQRYKVEKVKKIIREHNALGLTMSDQNKIQLQTTGEQYELPKDRLDQTFYHELVHCFLYELHEHELNNREDFVDRMGSLLHQYMCTKKF